MAARSHKRRPRPTPSSDEAGGHIVADVAAPSSVMETAGVRGFVWSAAVKSPAAIQDWARAVTRLFTTLVPSYLAVHADAGSGAAGAGPVPGSGACLRALEEAVLDLILKELPVDTLDGASGGVTLGRGEASHVWLHDAEGRLLLKRPLAEAATFADACPRLFENLRGMEIEFAFEASGHQRAKLHARRRALIDARGAPSARPSDSRAT